MLKVRIQLHSFRKLQEDLGNSEDIFLEKSKLPLLMGESIVIEILFTIRCSTDLHVLKVRNPENIFLQYIFDYGRQVALEIGDISPE